MTAYHIVIPDNLDSIGVDLLRAEPDFRLTVGPLKREETLATVADADALIVRSATKVDADMIAAAPKLKIVARAGVGVDNIDLQAAGERGIVVVNAPEGNVVAAAEHTFALLLSLCRNIPAAQQSMLEGRWDRKNFMGVQLRGKTMGIIGLGRVGRRVARRAGAFRTNVIAYDPMKEDDYFRRAEAQRVDLDTLLAQSDFISLHAPATSQTRGMINAGTIARMKDGVYIINTARGALINDAALAEALRSGKVAGAALDVYEPEPPSADHPLIGLPNVIHTPHLGASTAEAQLAVAEEAARLVRDGLREGRYSNVVNNEFLNLPAEVYTTGD